GRACRSRCEHRGGAERRGCRRGGDAVRRVLLTGASGFIGRACIGPLLSRGFEVHAASRMTRESWPNVSVWPVDLLDRAAMEVLVRRVAPSHLLHTAWDVTHGAFWTARAN